MPLVALAGPDQPWNDDRMERSVSACMDDPGCMAAYRRRLEQDNVDPVEFSRRWRDEPLEAIVGLILGIAAVGGGLFFYSWLVFGRGKKLTSLPPQKLLDKVTDSELTDHAVLLDSLEREIRRGKD
jgi:hypothetical protein